jgi:hypothetical protein
MNRYLKENLNPGLTMTPLTPLLAPIPPSPLIETQEQGRPPETQEFSFPFVPKETGRGGSRSQG